MLENIIFVCVSISLLSHIVDTIWNFFYEPQVFRVVLRKIPFLYKNFKLVGCNVFNFVLFFFSTMYFPGCFTSKNHINRMSLIHGSLYLCKQNISRIFDVIQHCLYSQIALQILYNTPSNVMY